MKVHDVFVIGGGIAGLRAAIEAKIRGTDAAVMSMLHPLRSHSVAAQGGINAALGNVDSNDSVEKHAFDTIKGSDYLADQDAVLTFCQDAITRIKELDRWGCPFSRLENGKIAQRPFGGSEHRRTCYAADKTGHAVMHTVYQQALRLGVKFYDEWVVLRLASDNDRVSGLVAYNTINGHLEGFGSKAIILATGGAGRIYARTTNSHHSTGFGMALGYWAGAPLMDMEFIQFHPTTLYGTNILITEGARGEGGYLYNAKNQRFMEDYAPDLMELAPRDIVARAITSELSEGRGYSDEYVHLDITHLGKEAILKKLPQIYDIAKSFSGVDPTKDPIPVQPGQHYTMGGIETDMWGRCRVKGLYAAGETACVSVHGANRLGGNSLLDCVVFGARAGMAVSQDIESFKKMNESAISRTVEVVKDRLSELESGKGSVNQYKLRKDLQQTMWENVGIFRKEEDLIKARNEITEYKSRYLDVGYKKVSKTYNTSLLDAFLLEGILDVSQVVAEGALKREESRGSHYRLDYKQRDDENWVKHTLAFYSEKGPNFLYKPVTITSWPIKEREY